MFPSNGNQALAGSKQPSAFQQSIKHFYIYINPSNIYHLFQDKDRNTRETFEICSNLLKY